jgi:hypothetical protein
MTEAVALLGEWCSNAPSPAIPRLRARRSARLGARALAPASRYGENAPAAEEGAGNFPRRDGNLDRELVRERKRGPNRS